MERLYSPWRSVYLESFAEKKEQETCVFCSASSDTKDDKDSLVVHNGKKVFVLMNLFPYNNGHLLVIPKRHIAKFSELDIEERIEIFELIDRSITALEKGLGAQAFNLGCNLGKIAGAGIEDHLHFHIVPRWNGDTNFMPVIGEVKLISEDLQKTRQKLINNF